MVDQQGASGQPRADRFIRIYRMAAPSSAGRKSIEKERETMFEYAKALLDLYLPEKAEGQGLVEYALIIALISVALVGALIALRGGIAEVFTDIQNAFNNSGS
ncbi:Flp family type IVb pilin [Thermomicrobiaceae bacterium CFH 74404]|uniref:Flp family type IVb pilin n=1 Tax=Thermalbibacter longus TaxID=2951981 RepID=A0AA41WA93_9BACT|nr:Flp family type IVb pilin [Thermalbibacter longus]MCM8748482.1 Flp family type IVb pilin [Thermalbibacter longus]